MSTDPAAVRELEERVDALESSGRYDEAVEVLGQLEELTGEDQRWHVAWMHVLAGRRGASDAIWAALEREHPGDPTVPFLAGNAHAEAGQFEVAAELFERALAQALELGADAETLRRLIGGRTEALAKGELEPGPIDAAARRALARATAQGADALVITPYFGRAAFDEAITAFPSFAASWGGGHADYAHELDRRMRAVAPGAHRRPVVVPLTVDEVRASADAHDLDPDWAEARERAACDLAKEGRAVAWPPGRNEPCWCGSRTKYKRCCGR